jgi:hypothetical protein
MHDIGGTTEHGGKRTGERGELADYLVIFSLVCVAGHVSLIEGGHHQAGLLLLAFCYGLFLVIRRKSLFTCGSALTFVFFGAILVGQSLCLSSFPMITILGFFIRLFVGYAGFRLVKNFPRKYVNVLYAICLFSLMFYIPDQICRASGLDFRKIFKPLHDAFGSGLSWRYDIGVYNLQLKK